MKKNRHTNPGYMGYIFANILMILLGSMLLCYAFNLNVPFVIKLPEYIIEDKSIATLTQLYSIRILALLGICSSIFVSIRQFLRHKLESNILLDRILVSMGVPFILLFAFHSIILAVIMGVSLIFVCRK